MSAATVLERIALAGVTLTALDADHLAATPADRLTDELRGLIRANKGELLRILMAGTSKEPREDAERLAKVVATLHAKPGLRYVVETHTDIDPDDVILSLAIRGAGACEVRIPRSRYDGFRVLEAIEKHTRRETLQ